MKKLVTILALGAALSLTACGSVAQPDAAPAKQPAADAPAAEAPAPEPLDLAGTWKSIDGEASGNNYQQAVITADTISIDWIDEAEGTAMVYWVGTFDAPTEPGDTWKWTSVRDAAATDTALLASSDDTKQFEYKNGQLSYELTMMGETTTLHLEKQ